MRLRNTALYASSDQEPSEQHGYRSKPPHESDSDLLDAYSQAVVGVVETVSPAVVVITGPRGQGPQGSGSGFLIAPDGYVVTNSHVVGGRDRLDTLTIDGDRIPPTTGHRGDDRPLPRRLVRELDLLVTGILPGNLIVAVNDRLVTDVDDLHRLLTSLPIDVPLDLSIVQSNELRTVVVPPRFP